MRTATCSSCGRSTVRLTVHQFHPLVRRLQRRLSSHPSGAGGLGDSAPLGWAVHQAIGAGAACATASAQLPDTYCLVTAHYTEATVASFDEQVLRAAEHEGLAFVGATGRRLRGVEAEQVAEADVWLQTATRRSHPAQIRSFTI